jgi:carbamoylphosphate synthase large subunit
MRKIMSIGFDEEGAEAIKAIRAKGFNVTAVIRKLVKDFAASTKSGKNAAKI